MKVKSTERVAHLGHRQLQAEMVRLDNTVSPSAES